MWITARCLVPQDASDFKNKFLTDTEYTQRNVLPLWNFDSKLNVLPQRKHIFNFHRKGTSVMRRHLRQPTLGRRRKQAIAFDNLSGSSDVARRQVKMKCIAHNGFATYKLSMCFLQCSPAWAFGVCLTSQQRCKTKSGQKIPRWTDRYFKAVECDDLTFQSHIGTHRTTAAWPYGAAIFCHEYILLPIRRASLQKPRPAWQSILNGFTNSTAFARRLRLECAILQE